MDMIASPCDARDAKRPLTMVAPGKTRPTKYREPASPAAAELRVETPCTLMHMSEPPARSDLAQLWRRRDPSAFTSRRLQALGAGSPTDWGMSARQPDPALQPVSLAGGIPDTATLPRAALLQAGARALGLDPEAPESVLRAAGSAPLSYGGAYGYEPLREEIARFFARDHHPPIGADHFVLTNGAAGAIDLLCAALLDPGDVVVSEVPAFSGSLRTLRGHGARLVGVPMDRQGLRIDALRDTLRTLDRAGTPAKLIYVSPTFHNPTGSTMPLERRRDLVELAAHHGALLLEDTAYNELYFGGEPLPTLGALAQGHFVITVGTFSKVIAPGLRVGWLQGRPELIRLLLPARFDMGNSPLLHRILFELMIGGELARHVERMRIVYRDKMRALTAALRAHCPAELHFEEPAGGFFLWLRLPEGLAANRVQEHALDTGVVFPVGSAFYLRDGPPEAGEHIRLAYSRSSPEELQRGAERLAAALRRAAGG